MKTKKNYFPPECRKEDLMLQNILCISNVEALMIDSWLEDNSISPLFP